jgi:glutathione synthase/RimK-type ligase-like ATP-grasp enzyme
VAPHGLQVEAWIPKAGVDGQIADLRILVVDGEPAFRVLRKSRHPITNLHLGGERADAGALLSQMPARAVAALDDTCHQVALAFPGALQLGLDVAVAAGLARHYVLEVNAFGDLLKGVATSQGLDAHDVQLRAMERAA